MEDVDIGYTPDTPGGMEYGLEDGEITDEPEDQVQLSEQEVQDAEYDPLMAGNFESDDDDDAGPKSPDDIASPPASPADSNSAVIVETVERSPSASPPQGPASPTSSVDDGPSSPVEDFEPSSLRGILDSQAEGPASPTGSMDEASEGEVLSQHDNHPEREFYSPPASPTDSLQSQGHESQKQGSDHGSGHSQSGSPASPRSEGHDVSAPASPSADSLVEDMHGSSEGVRSRSLSPVDDADAETGGQRASAGDRSRSSSGSPARSGSRVSTPLQSRSPSPSAAPAEIRSQSPSVSGSSRSASLAAAAGSRSVSRSRSVSPAGSRSPSVRSHSQSRSGSLGGSRSGSVSPALSCSPSRSPAQSRSPSASPAHDRDQPSSADRVQVVAGDDDEDDVVDHGPKGDEGEASDKESAVGELIADIFGSSDEEEEFEGFGNAEVEISPKKDKKRAVIASDDENDAESVLPELSGDEDVENEEHNRADFVSDFDLMLQRKKDEMKKRRRRRRDFDIINDNDDLIDDLIRRMMEAAEEDQSLNQQKKPAVKKLQMLPQVMSQLKKADLHNAFLDSGVLKSITAWLVPLPDKSLPHLHIRESLLRQLLEFPSVTSDALKHSGIGKAVMYLYKHPKELRPNKEMAGKLINEWSRPIFNLTSNYKNLSREEREQRDYEQLPKKRRISLEGGATPRRDIDRELVGEEKVLRPGDPGYIYRARVPQPSHKDYVIRPKWNIEDKPKGSGKKPANKFEQHMRAYKRKSAAAKGKRAVGMSIEGRNMAL